MLTKCPKCGWKKSKTFERCQECQRIVENYIHKGTDNLHYNIAKRCTFCKIQINFFPENKQVTYGSEIMKYQLSDWQN